MKTRFSKNGRKNLLIYLLILVLLYLVIILTPRVTDIFESTEILEPGELKMSCDASGYFIKKEAIATAENAPDW